MDEYDEHVEQPQSKISEIYYTLRASIWRHFFIVTHFRKPTLAEVLKHVYSKGIAKIFKKHQMVYDIFSKKGQKEKPTEGSGYYFNISRERGISRIGG